MIRSFDHRRGPVAVAVCRALGVGQDPVQPGSHPGIDAGEARLGTPVAPAYDTHHSIVTILLNYQRTSIISPSTYPLAIISSTDISAEITLMKSILVFQM